MKNKVQTVTLNQLRKMIREEAQLLQGKDAPEDVSPAEMAWEDAEDVGKQDFVAQMDKPTPALKKEAHVRRLRRRAAFLQRRLQEAKQELATLLKK